MYFNFSGLGNVKFKLWRAMQQSEIKFIDTSTLVEFKTIFKYLTFVACAAKAPFRQKMLDETLEQIKKVGAVENIQRWCFWTPAQLCLMEQAEDVPRMAIVGGNGTGKTLMLDTYATKLAKEGKYVILGKVTFLRYG